MRCNSVLRSARLLVQLTLGALLAACGDTAPVAPRAALPPMPVGPLADYGQTNPVPESAYIGSANVLQRLDALGQMTYEVALIDPAKGGALHMPSLGLKVEFPPRAVTQPTWVWVIAHPGRDVYYEFGPHGTNFLKDVKIQQDLKFTTAYKTPALANALRGAYLPAGTSDLSGGTAKVAETFDVEITPENNGKNPRQAKFGTHHFSGYVFASGFTSTHYDR